MTAANSAPMQEGMRRVGAAPTALAQVLKGQPAAGDREFQPLPSPTGEPPYRLRLSEVLPADEMLAIERAGRLRFHCVGDTGGIHNPIPQATVAEAMTTERRGADPVRFFYHLGDIVYLFGEEANYGDQFSAPYSGYDAPIFAIPGNHDGGRAPGASADSLEAFVRHFCLPSPTLPRSADTGGRPASRQPNVFWTLRHDWITIVGLYTNVAEGGQIADDQARWLTSELGAAPRGVTLILALHHTRDGRKIPYVVAGTGGFHELHEIGTGILQTPTTFDGLPDVTLHSYQDTRFGFMTVTATAETTEIAYNVVEAGEARVFDRFAIAPRDRGAQRDTGVEEPRRVRAAWRSLNHVPRTARANRIP